MRVLLVEDDVELSRQVCRWLTEAGSNCEGCDRGGKALEALRRAPFDIVILDVGLPDMDGFAVVERLRAEGFKMPVLFLSARDGVTDRVRGLKSGGDDYLTKPFAVEELLARMEVLQRRTLAAEGGSSPRRFGKWVFDPLRRRLRSDIETVELQPREGTLIDVFLAHEGRVLTKRFLLEQVWDIRFDPGTNVVDAMVCRLRRKIDTPGRPSHIETIRGKGYVFHAFS
jgi:two-component system OmpR family response regulator